MVAHDTFAPGAIALIVVGAFAFGVAVGALISEYTNRRGPGV